MTNETKIEQYQCTSYYENDILKNCICGKCTPLFQTPKDEGRRKEADHIISTCDRLKEALLACYELDRRETAIQVEKKKARCELNLRREELASIRFN